MYEEYGFCCLELYERLNQYTMCLSFGWLSLAWGSLPRGPRFEQWMVLHRTPGLAKGPWHMKGVQYPCNIRSCWLVNRDPLQWLITTLPQKIPNNPPFGRSHGLSATSLDAPQHILAHSAGPSGQVTHSFGHWTCDLEWLAAVCGFASSKVRGRLWCRPPSTRYVPSSYRLDTFLQYLGKERSKSGLTIVPEGPIQMDEDNGTLHFHQIHLQNRRSMWTKLSWEASIRSFRHWKNHQGPRIFWRIMKMWTVNENEVWQKCGWLVKMYPMKQAINISRKGSHIQIHSACLACLSGRLAGDAGTPWVGFGVWKISKQPWNSWMHYTSAIALTLRPFSFGPWLTNHLLIRLAFQEVLSSSNDMNFLGLKCGLVHFMAVFLSLI